MMKKYRQRIVNDFCDIAAGCLAGWLYESRHPYCALAVVAIRLISNINSRIPVEQ